MSTAGERKSIKTVWVRKHDIPRFVHRMHSYAINGTADQYTHGKIAGFIITPEDEASDERLEGMDQVFLVYRGLNG